MTVLLRVLCAVSGLMMLGFMAVQYNDPDGLFWVAIYSVPAVLATIASLSPAVLVRRRPTWIVRLAIGAALVGCVHFFPRTPSWWTSEVWYETETAREGMGMMIVLLVLLIVQVTIASFRRRQRII